MSAVGDGGLQARPSLDRRLAARARAEAEAGDWPHTTRLLPWGIAAFLVMIWLVPFDNVNLPISLPLDATLDRPLLVSVFLLWLLATATENGARWHGATAVHWALAVFGLIAVVSLLGNTHTLAGLGELDPALKKLLLLLTYGLLFVVASSVIRPSEAPRFVALMVGLASVTAVGILIEYRFGYNAFYIWTGSLLPGTTTPPPDAGTYDSIGRLTVIGPGNHPLAPATMMAVALPFAVVSLMDSTERRDKILYSIASGLILGAALATQRKTSLVLPVTCMVVLFAYRPRPMLRMLPMAVALLIAIHVVVPGAIGGVADQLKPGALTGVLTTQDRVSDYDAIRPEIANHPLLGRGYESYNQKKYRILDNQYLTLLIGVGVLGVIAYVAMFASAFVYAHRSARSRDPVYGPIATACAAALVALTIGSALLDTLSLPQLPYLFCLVAALAVVCARGRREAMAP